MNGGTASEVLADFVVNIYRGCVLPEDYRAVRTTSWVNWAGDNPDDYTPEQLELIRLRLLAGKSWVCFVTRLETISAPDHYKPQTVNRNPVQPKERIY